MAPRAGEHSDANCIYCAAVLGSPSQHLLTLVAAASLAAGLAACGDDDSDTSSTSAAEATTSVKAVSTDTCGDVEYGGSEEPDLLITSDLPLQGDSAKRSEQQVEAIRLALEDAEWKAGDFNVALQSCDDTIAKTGLWDVKTCQDNADAYAEDPDVIGVIGTYNSGCAAEIIPILNEAPDGPVAMISPGNTAVSLTADEKLYPSGDRNYARVIPNDAYQGAALAELADDKSAGGTIAVLYAADDDTSIGQADNFEGAAKELGLKTETFSWDPKAKDYEALMGKVAKINPGAVVLAGLTELNAGQVISDKVGVVGSNEKVPLIGFDGLTQQSTIDESHGAAAGMYASIPGRAPENLTGRGAEFADALESTVRRRGAGAVRARGRRGHRGPAAGDRGGQRRARRDRRGAIRPPA